ncbi:hypothetical protein, partial [Xanthomonas hortorum]|uniref:hypothetical protein n=1 Tax=Xanthomonas hortorum TaxID=56454 RepID=UPI002FDFD8F9
MAKRWIDANHIDCRNLLWNPQALCLPEIIACPSAAVKSGGVVPYPGAGPCGGMNAATEPTW